MTITLSQLAYFSLVYPNCGLDWTSRSQTITLEPLVSDRISYL